MPRSIRQLAAVSACISHYMLQTQLLVILFQMIDTLILLRSEVRATAAEKREWKQRLAWSKFSNSLSDKQFRRMFRMPRDCFDLLCSRIIKAVGESEFKSETYLEMLEHAPGTTMMGRVYCMHKQYYGGLICGEIKLAITLRLMAGGSYLDLAALYVCGYTYVYSIFHYVTERWICNEKVIAIELYNQIELEDESAMKEVATDFAQGSSKGIMYGCIGAIDGWLVKIKCPSKLEGVQNAGGFFSRKGYFALNVQVIVDKYKRVTWFSINCRGGEHDSTALESTSFYGLLLAKSRYLASKGWFIIGDLAYSLCQFLITSFDNVRHGSAEDNFNFFNPLQEFTWSVLSAKLMQGGGSSGSL